jgi:hypothetical protein
VAYVFNFFILNVTNRGFLFDNCDVPTQSGILTGIGGGLCVFV